MEVTNIFKGLDQIDRVPEELWTEVFDIIQKVVIISFPKRKKCKKAKWLSEKGLQTAEKRRESKGKEEKERYIHLNESSKVLQGDLKKSSSVINAKK